MLWPALVQLLIALSLVSGLTRRSSLAPAPSDDLFSRLYNRSIARQRTLRSVRARFTETTVSTLLVKPAVAHGTILAAPPARVRMTYTDPERKTLTMDGQTLQVAWEDRDHRERLDISQIQTRIDRYFREASIDQLRSMFEITATPDGGADHLEMRPKRKQIKQGLERLDLWIDRETVMLVQMRMTFPGGDHNTIALDDVTINVPVTDETFRVRR